MKLQLSQSQRIAFNVLVGRLRSAWTFTTSTVESLPYITGPSRETSLQLVTYICTLSYMHTDGEAVIMLAFHY